ncbi:Outer membrane lipoprotein carrier protein LolA [Arboricoccus pini]|uniref:Outer membrane lipoprotein carrier protein LolA n=1 Tax=Arboricoccus pini TaxID=1963835 RepID=A0A212R450_9PROT|nr:outer membrane lipoprotein carrier protein LolA [Arboricoccus pini]SNB66784.1 Outer membrane lipoprotein carrier protein LolA [Arboricoccus pini]
MALLAATSSKDASFKEEKHLSALDQPVVSQGWLRFRAPARLEKHTTSPITEDLVVDGNRLLLDKPAENVHYDLDLRQVPELASLVEAVRGVLAGDIQSLRAHYSVGLEGQAPGWKLTLVPTEARVKELLKVVRIEGREGTVQDVTTIQPNGDLSSMQIQPLAVGN